jgi:hypothetical protein
VNHENGNLPLIGDRGAQKDGDADNVSNTNSKQNQGYQAVLAQPSRCDRGGRCQWWRRWSRHDGVHGCSPEDFIGATEFGGKVRVAESRDETLPGEDWLNAANTINSARIEP